MKLTTLWSFVPFRPHLPTPFGRRFCDPQLARIADRVRRMALHSPLAAVLAGVELTLRKAQDWEQHAHRGVSLKEELRTLSSLVVRWRAVELQSWPQLLDARERSFASKVKS